MALRDELSLILGLCTAILSTVGSHDLATAQQPQQQQGVTLQQRQSNPGPIAVAQRPIEKGDQMLLVRAINEGIGGNANKHVIEVPWIHRW